jgi:hypothetical protein
MSPQRIFVRCEDVKEPKTEDDFFNKSVFSVIFLSENAKSRKKCTSCRRMIWNVAVQKTWPEPHKMDENKIPHEIEDRNKKDTNPDAKKMLPIPATEEEAHKAGFRKNVERRTRGKPSGGTCKCTCANYSSAKKNMVREIGVSEHWGSHKFMAIYGNLNIEPDELNLCTWGAQVSDKTNVLLIGMCFSRLG